MRATGTRQAIGTRAAGAATAGREDGAEHGYVLWTHIGPESVFFYPPGSVEEHLVTEHGIPSLDVRRQIGGSYDHVGDHAKQLGVAVGAVGDLVAFAHAHTAADAA